MRRGWFSDSGCRGRVGVPAHLREKLGGGAVLDSRVLIWLTAPVVALGALAGAGQPNAQAAPARPASFLVGAAVGDFSPPCGPDANPVAQNCTTPQGFVDPTSGAACLAPPGFTGRRPWAFMEPYVDLKNSGHWDVGDPWVDCDPTNGAGRWEGNFLGGGSNAPRLFTKIADPVTARAIVVGNGAKTIAVEVEDHEGLFDTYQQQIRDKVAADLKAKGLKPLDGIFISSTHDESAPDTIGLYAGSDFPSSVNHYGGDYLVQRSAEAIERAYAAQTPARVRYAEAIEPPNMRQCFSSYPFIDDQLMPTMEAVDAKSGRVIAILGNVSQHTETLGFNGGGGADPGQGAGGATLDQEKDWVSADWPYWFRTALEAAHPGAVAVEMAGSVGSNETPEVFTQPLSRTPQQFVDEGHPAGCRTLYTAPVGPGGALKPLPLGYYSETRALGQQLAQAVDGALATSGTYSSSGDVYGIRADSCVRVTNVLFGAIGATGEFGNRPSYDPTCTVAVGPAPNGSAAGTSVKTQVAFFRIGDGEFASVPGEVFPFTYLRSFEGPGDMPCPDPNPPSDPTNPNPCYMPGQGQFPLPAWLMPHMHTPYRFIDGLGEDMVGYIFPQGNGIGVPGEYPTDPAGSGTDRFGCGHSDDSEAASSQAGQILGDSLVTLLDGYEQGAESISEGRYVLPDGRLSRDPLGGPEIKCSVDRVFSASGPAVAVWQPGRGLVTPARWMSLSGRPQSSPDRNTRGYLDRHGARHWLDVYPDIAGAPARVALASPAAAATAVPMMALPVTVGAGPTQEPSAPGATDTGLASSRQAPLPAVLAAAGAVLIVLLAAGTLIRNRGRKTVARSRGQSN